MTPFISADRLRLYELWESQAWTAAANTDDDIKRKKLEQLAMRYRVRIRDIERLDSERGACRE